MSAASPAPVRVVLIDDHLIVREGLRLVLESAGDIEVIADTDRPDEVLALAAAGAVDVVLTDLRMPVMDGGELVRRLTAQAPKVRSLVLTTYDDEEEILSAIEGGACGYLLKDTGRRELVDAIRSAARGDTVLSPTIVTKLAARLRRPPPATLSAREIDVLRRVATGMTNARIGVELCISEATVKTHLHHVFTKLDVDDRTAAVTAARRLGVLD
jgi:DNA-binding NarL/FixJ family response regulator